VGNLIAILQRFSHFFIFLLLQFICFRMLYKSSPKHGNSIVKGASEIAGTVLAEKKSVSDYFNLKSNNAKLLKENEMLRQRLLQEEKGIPITDSFGNVTFKKDSVEKKFRYHYFAAKVLDHTFDEPNNYMTLNLGAYNGIKTGMSVLSAQGVAGIIVSVSPHFSVAKCIISERFKISAKLKDGTLGYISWPKLDSRIIQLNDISASAKVKRGDTVYTSTSSMFPANVMIGTVLAFKPSTEANNYLLAASTNFKRLEYVYIVEDITAEEVHAVLDSAKALEKLLNPKAK
jgi:rod shape-determining protein MreC